MASTVALLALNQLWPSSITLAPMSPLPHTFFAKKLTTLSIAATPSRFFVAASVSSNDGFPKYTRLLPCPSQKVLPYRVEHLVVSEGGTVLDCICKMLNLPPLFVADLILFGAVHYALVCPRPPPSATPEQIRIFREVTAPSVLKTRSSIKGKTVREAQKTFRITQPDEFVEPAMYLRVHVHPKRSPRICFSQYPCCC